MPPRDRTSSKPTKSSRPRSPARPGSQPWPGKKPRSTERERGRRECSGRSDAARGYCVTCTEMQITLPGPARLAQQPWRSPSTAHGEFQLLTRPLAFRRDPMRNGQIILFPKARDLADGLTQFIASQMRCPGKKTLVHLRQDDL